MWVVLNAKLNRLVFPNIIQGKECPVVDTTPFMDEEEANRFQESLNQMEQEIGGNPSFEVLSVGE